MEASEPWDGSNRSSYGPCLPDFNIPPAPQDLVRALNYYFLYSAPQLSIYVPPSSGGKQPVPVGLLWSQQTAFISSNFKTLQKARVGR